ncbi:MAG: glycoside hydrolase family 95 protein [Ruminococcaceae bacterium]|jgi:alpha-L-fucosidase 2|nr:glycoside hydrolase family 95 protein [Oscillospiraceae bacterium]
MKNYVLHLVDPASQWDNTSPVGCGSAGLSVWGGIAEDRLTLNEESIWDGGPMDTKVDGFTDMIEHVRSLFLEGKEYEANRWAEENMKDCFNRIKAYEYAGELFVKIHGDDAAENYRRDLDLTDGVCTVAYEKDGVSYKRTFFASYPARLLAGRYEADAPFSASIRFRRENVIRLIAASDSLSAIAATATTENRFLVKTKIVSDGKCSVSDAGISVTNATKIELYTVIVTAFKSYDLVDAAEDRLEVAAKGWDALYEEHTADHRALMNRSDLSFDAPDPAVDALPVSERLERLRSDPDARDDSLLSLYFAFGKYLLIGSSRPGTLPANLQGVWATGLTPPWNSDYHTNINLQMNYWQAEEANLGECTSALFDYMNRYLLPGGEKVARENYGVRGTVIHHLSDIYGFAAAADGLWGLWPLGGAWLAYHMWEHWLYTGDRDFLLNTAYRYIRKCAEFFIDTLFEGPDGYLHSGPSTSPENAYLDAEGRRVNLAISPTMDIEIIGGLLDFYAECEDILCLDPVGGRRAREVRAKMPPLQIGKHGQLMEWIKDYDESEPGHRHISHAFGLYPAAQISRNTPELFKAIEVTLNRRLASGGGHTGWSRAWLINLFARLGKGQEAYDNVRLLFTKSTIANLFDTHPPFQIDGNFGGAAGIGEMVLQSHDGAITLLPAVPAWLNGSFRGLRARGGYTVDAAWKDGKILSLTVRADRPGTVKIRIPGQEIEAEVSAEGTKIV